MSQDMCRLSTGRKPDCRSHVKQLPGATSRIRATEGSSGGQQGEVELLSSRQFLICHLPSFLS